MVYFVIAEVDDGHTIVECDEGELAEDAALKQGGTLIDAGPYSRYEEAADALDALEANVDDLGER